MVTMEAEKRNKARRAAFGVPPRSSLSPTTSGGVGVGVRVGRRSSGKPNSLLSPLLPARFRWRNNNSISSSKYSPTSSASSSRSPSAAAAAAADRYNNYVPRLKSASWPPPSASSSLSPVAAQRGGGGAAASTSSASAAAVSAAGSSSRSALGRWNPNKPTRGGGGGGGLSFLRGGNAGFRTGGGLNGTAEEEDGDDAVAPYELDRDAALRLELSARRFLVDFRRILPEQEPLPSASSPPWSDSTAHSPPSSSSDELDLRALWGVSMNDVVYHVLRPMAAAAAASQATATTSAFSTLSAALSGWSTHRQQQKQDAILRRYHLLNTIDRLQTDLLRWTSTHNADEDGLDRRFFDRWDDDGPNILRVLIRQNGYVTCWKQIKELLVRGKYFAFPPSSLDGGDNTGTGGSVPNRGGGNNDPILDAYESRLLATSLQSMSLELPPSQRKLLAIVASGTTHDDEDNVPALLDADKSQDETFTQKVSREQRLLELTRDHEQRHEQAAVKAVKASLEAEEEAEKRAGSLMRPLSDEELQLVREAMYGRGSDDEILAREGTDTVMRSSMRKLAPRQWLNDEVIHFFYMMLAKRDAELCRLDPARKRCHFFKSFFITKLLQEGHALYDGVYDYKSVKRWSKNVPGKDIFALDKIFFPINVGRSHWVCAVAFMQLQKIQFFDSLGADGMEYMEHLFHYLQDEHLDKKKAPLPNADEWKLIPCDPNETPQQLNGYDCGVFTCMFADFISKDCPLVFEQEHISQCRERIALAILQGQAIV